MAINDGRVVSNFIVQGLRDEPLTIFGDGAQTRSFCFVSDLIDGLVRLMNLKDPQFTGPVNLGNPEEFTMKELALMIKQLTGSGSELVARPLPSDDPRQRQPDITLAGAVLGWTPTVDVRTGLERTVEYFRSHLAELESAFSAPVGK